MSLEEKLASLEAIIARMEYVADGQYVYTRHLNFFVDWLKLALDVCKQFYEVLKTKTGFTYPYIENWLSMAESRIGLLSKVKFGDVVQPKDHNLIIDTLKPLELALISIEKESRVRLLEEIFIESLEAKLPDRELTASFFEELIAYLSAIVLSESFTQVVNAWLSPVLSESFTQTVTVTSP
jgi:hypothetical protein